MANPENINITSKDTWQKVATNVKTGRVEFEPSTIPNHYKYTYVGTGEAAPTETLIGIRMSKPLEFNHSDSVDIYIMAVGDVGIVQVQI